MSICCAVNNCETNYWEAEISFVQNRIRNFRRNVLPNPTKFAAASNKRWLVAVVDPTSTSWLCRGLNKPDR